MLQSNERRNFSGYSEEEEWCDGDDEEIEVIDPKALLPISILPEEGISFV